MNYFSPWLRAAAVMTALLGAGCTSGSSVVGADGGNTDVAPDVRCTTGQSVCGATCADLQTDPNHCGTCGTACARTEACVAGQCALQCPTGQTVCGGRCVDLQGDRANCGTCGTACMAGQVCSAGQCAASCGGSTVACAGDCVNTMIDPRHCGMCGNACMLPGVATAACFGGACGVGLCTAGFADCDASPTNGCEVNTRGTDVANCGACGRGCTFANAAATCEAGTCRMGACMMGFADCDGNAANGCEVNLATDNAHCGACSTPSQSRACTAGQVCSAGACGTTCGGSTTNCGGDCVNTTVDPAHCGACDNRCALANASVSACAGGRCVVGGCTEGFADCDANAANGCETSVRGTDITNCGGCGLRCAFANAAATCSNGTCTLGTCAMGFANCDGNAANGCEVNLATDSAHCGACSVQGQSRACVAGQVCAAGVCGATCGAGTVDCGGSCSNTASDPSHCGACGTVCALANVRVQACSGSACVVGGCATGFADCDGVSGNGCETAVRATDLNNCGGCGIQCAFANAAATCSNGTCAMGACAAGFANCDGNAANGCEVNTRADNNNCGSCNTACPAGQLCGNGTCSLSCPTGQTGCSGRCADLQRDANNCGTCGTVCGAGQICQGGACVVSCPAGLANCGGTCRDLSVDRANCGICARACRSDQLCGSGTCACTAGLTECSGLCRDLQSDRAHCGACGRACATGTVCSAGACVSTCPSGQSVCSGTCRDVQNDPSNCGVCATVCNGTNGTPSCSGGTCRISCTTGFGNCDNNVANGCETNLAGDANNCGACGNVCPSGRNCASGTCTTQTVPGFTGVVGPNYGSEGWIQCVGVLDRQNVDDLPQNGWANACIGTGYRQLRMACGASTTSVRYIDVARNLFASPLVSYPETGLIINANFTIDPQNQIYAEGMNPNTNRSWWGNGAGCTETSLSITINNSCTWDVANCFGQNLMGDRYFFVYVRP